ncbi:MAG: 3-oxoacid CoA-transferase, subunit [Glaciihabitans sp.]|jgi:3-oxoacid CoA-transferase subunit B|nr:3-oxoacid CoA-transferase, subunit [Glaciihabitans sp.]MDQ1570592.1 3-oxoacid CoA-transferase subunit [Actinomycetota bacterium]
MSTISETRVAQREIALFGDVQISAAGDLAAGSLADLAETSADGTRLTVRTEHLDWHGKPRIVTKCTLPVTAAGCVDRIVTDLAVIEFEQNGRGERSLVLRELAPGVSIARVVEATGAMLRIPPELIRPGSSL